MQANTKRPAGRTKEVYSPKGCALAMEVIEGSDGMTHYITVDSSGSGPVEYHQNKDAAIRAVDKSSWY